MNSPIVIFTYKRLEETKCLIESLLKNKLSTESDLVIFSDYFKTVSDEKKVSEVRDYLKQITGFKTIKIYEQTKNLGLAESIIKGVTKVLLEYDRAIVLEDDLEVSEDFLEYMNQALETYKDDQRIWSVSGYSPQLEISSKNLYLAPRACSWGWGTWKDRWSKNDWDIKEYNQEKKNKLFKTLFNIGGNDLFLSLKKQIEFSGNSWAIRWCYNQLKNGCYTVYPSKSKVINNGFGEDATHSYHAEASKWKVNLVSEKMIFDKNLKLDFQIINAFNKKHKFTFRSYLGFILRKFKLNNLLKQLKHYY